MACKKVLPGRHPSLILVLLLLTACASGPERPVFYYGSYIEPVDRAESTRDTNECMALARQAGVRENRDGNVGNRAASGALLGGIAAGAWSLIRGNGGENVVAGAVAGGATGTAKGMLESNEQSPTFRRYVEHCLEDRGYRVIGWE